MKIIGNTFFASAVLIFALVISCDAFGQIETVRIAYVTSNSGALAEKRALELKAALDAQAKIASPRTSNFVIDLYRYDLREIDEKPTTEAAIVNAQMVNVVLTSNPSVIYAAGAAAAKTFAAATSKTPIIIGCKCNPGPTSRRWNLIANVCRPDANVTGFTRYDLRVIAPATNTNGCSNENSNTLKLENLFPARLQALRNSREIPIKRVGLILGDDYDRSKWRYTEIAKALGIETLELMITADQINDLPSLYRLNGLEAAMVFPSPLLDQNTANMVRITSKIAVPTMFPWDEADSGAWMHFGTKVDIASEAARYILAVLHGTPIKDLPVSFPTEYELVVNHKLAKSHGWVFPKKFLLLPQREPIAN
jgi:putative tryptophan/tyrosine transport system substrate-binding protein